MIDSSVEEIPEGLVLLPAPRPISRTRTGLLAAMAVVMGAGALAVALFGGDTSPLTGKPAPSESTHGHATLASSSVPEHERPEGDAPAARRGVDTGAAAKTPAGATGAQPDDARPEPSAQKPEQPSPDVPSAAAPPAQAASAGGSAAEEEGEATAASEPPAAPADAPVDGGDQPEPVLPDPSDTIRQVGDVADQVTDALPIPDLIGD